MNYLHIYKNSIAEILNNVYADGCEVDPLITNRLVFSIRAYFVAYRYVASRVHHFLGQNVTLDDCMEWIMQNFSADCPFLYIYKTTTEYVIDGDTYYIRTMSPISIYFTKYMDYSS